MMRRGKTSVATAIATALVATTLAACSGSNAAGGGDGGGGTLTIAITASELPSPDTVLSGGQGYEGYNFVGNQLYDALTGIEVSPDAPPKLVPGLAESWISNDDGSVWTFNLRKGVKFTDGSDFNADVVVYNLDRYSNPDSSAYSEDANALASRSLGPVTGYKKIDDYTVEISTDGPDAHLPEDLYFIYMASQEALEKLGNDGFADAPVGTGPFKFESLERGQKLTLVANKDYWNGAPKIEKLELKAIPDGAARVAALRSGDVDWAEAIGADDVEGLEGAGFKTQMNAYDNWWMWFLDNRKAPFDDIRVRQALNYAIDREAITEDLLAGTAAPLSQIASSANPAYRDDIGYGYDPEKAKELLKEAGYGDGLTITLGYPTNGSGMLNPSPMNQALAQQLEEVGVTVELKPSDFSVISGYIGTPEFPERRDAINFSGGWTRQSTWTTVLSSTGALNLGGYSNPEVDQLLAASNAETDPEKRNEIYAQINTKATEDAAWLIVASSLAPRALAPNVKGFEAPMSWFLDLNEVTVD